MAVGCEPRAPAGNHRAARAMRGLHQKERDAKPRTAPMARRRDGDIAPYRDGARQRGTVTGRCGEGARQRGGAAGRCGEAGHGDGAVRLGGRATGVRNGLRRGDGGFQRIAEIFAGW